MKKQAIVVTSDQLRDFASMNMTWSDICPEDASEVEPSSVICDSYHRLTPDDLREVAERCLDSSITLRRFTEEWWEPLMLFFYQALGLPDIYEEVTGSPDGLFDMKILPVTDEEITLWAFTEFTKCMSVYELPYMQSRPLSLAVPLEQMVRMIDWHLEDVGLKPELRRYVDVIKEEFIAEYDNDLILRDQDDRTRDIFRAFTDDLAEKNSFLALKIKGYACYGGSSVYQCDFKTAADCLERLFRICGVGYAANTLGYMYYHGELDRKGRPNYKAAFFYYSAAYAYGVGEAGIMLSRMLFAGQYTAPDPVLAYSMADRLYTSEKERFENDSGEGNYFAEAAYEMALIHKRKDLPVPPDFKGFLSRRFLLQAMYANQTSGGSPVLRDKIAKELKLSDHMFRIRKRSYSCMIPEPLMEFVSADRERNYFLRIKDLRNNRLKLTVTGMNSGSKEEARALVTYINFDCCELTGSISVTAEGVSSVECPVSRDNLILFNEINASEGRLSFCFGGRSIVTVRAERYRITRPAT